MNHYWFRAKKYGYGWEPCTWQGWLVLAGYVAGMVYVASRAQENMTDTFVVEELVTPMVLLTLLLVAISWRTGEPTKWRWGDKKKRTSNS
jgi:hypothetical protein